MRNSLFTAVVSLVFILAAQPASACMMMAGLKSDDIKFASVVVIGRIVNYEIVRATDEVSDYWRKTYGQKDVLSDYARFSVLVDEALVGQPPKVITVTWNNSTFGEPKTMKEGPYLIALREPGSQTPPLRGPSATILPAPEPKALTVLQAPCAPAFIFEASSSEAKSIREALDPSPAPSSSAATAPTRGTKEKLKPFEFAPAKDPRGTVGQAPTCSFPDLKLPEEFAVYAAGAYSGRKISFQLDQSGHEGTQIDVAVNSPNKPVVLMLGAYEPTIWNIGWTKNTKILAVLASGYHRQAIAGLDLKTPLLISSNENKGPCGYFYINEGKLDDLNPKARDLFRHPVDMVYPARNGYVVVGQALAGGTKLVTSAEVPPESYRDTSAPLAGPAGLKDAVDKGLLRKATASDAQAWAQAVERNSPKRDVPPVAGGAPKPASIELYNAYVVLKPFVYPAGLYGAHSAVFLIPKGIPKPAGNLGHSTVYDFNTLGCDGTSCDRQ